MFFWIFAFLVSAIPSAFGQYFASTEDNPEEMKEICLFLDAFGLIFFYAISSAIIATSIWTLNKAFIPRLDQIIAYILVTFLVYWFPLRSLGNGLYLMSQASKINWMQLVVYSAIGAILWSFIDYWALLVTIFVATVAALMHQWAKAEMEKRVIRLTQGLIHEKKGKPLIEKIIVITNHIAVIDDRPSQKDTNLRD